MIGSSKKPITKVYIPALILGCLLATVTFTLGAEFFVTPGGRVPGPGINSRLRCQDNFRRS